MVLFNRCQSSGGCLSEALEDADKLLFSGQSPVIPAIVAYNSELYAMTGRYSLLDIFDICFHFLYALLLDIVGLFRDAAYCRPYVVDKSRCSAVVVALAEGGPKSFSLRLEPGHNFAEEAENSDVELKHQLFRPHGVCERQLSPHRPEIRANLRQGKRKAFGNLLITDGCLFAQLDNLSTVNGK